MAYSTDGRVWAANRCELNVTGPGWPSAAWGNVVQAVIDAWNASGANFQFTTNAAAADHLAAYDLGPWNGWIAMTYTQPATSLSSLTSGQVLVNLHYQWDPAHPTWPHSDPGGAYDLHTALIHEFGHLLHLNDDRSAQDVMQPTIRAHTLRRNLGPDDLSGARYLYPPPPSGGSKLSPLLIEYSFEALARGAALIVEGTVQRANHAVWGLTHGDPAFPRRRSERPTPDMVFTAHELLVTHTLRGGDYMGIQEGSLLEILTMGGATTGMSLHVDSEAQFAPGESVMCFLTTEHFIETSGWGRRWDLEQVASETVTPLALFPRAEDRRYFSVLGGFQGKFDIYPNASGVLEVRNPANRGGASPRTLEEARRVILEIAGEEPLFATVS
jgi:hypothetical protein